MMNYWLWLLQIGFHLMVLPKGIPQRSNFKSNCYRFMELTSDIVPNWLLDTPDPNVAVGKLCEPFKVKWLLEVICLDMRHANMLLVKENLWCSNAR
jgi:hypothetical protein